LHWCNSGVIDETQSDALALGAMNVPEPEPEKPFEVLEENWPAVELFLRVQTCWQVGGLGTITGLCYQDVISVAKLYSVADLPAVFEDLQILEVTAMAEMNKEKK
tara:strand:+ start:661 stop:975 length:315 start_codon:yes stop_codon:yes gene_type:complete